MFCMGCWVPLKEYICFIPFIIGHGMNTFAWEMKHHDNLDKFAHFHSKPISHNLLQLVALLNLIHLMLQLTPFHF